MNNEYKLEELYELQMGKTPSRNDVSLWQTRDAKWISVGDLSNCGKYIYDTKEYLSDKAIQESHIKEIPAETLVMSFKLSLGKTAITKEKMYSNEAIMAFIDKHTVPLLNDYMYYLLSAKNWDEGTNKAVLGKTLNKATLSNIKVKIHPLPQQEKIASTLDKITSLISLHQKQLAKLDELVKARFVEMFGDPIANPMGLPVRKLKDISVLITNGNTPKGGSENYVDEGVLFLRSQNVWRNFIDLSDVAYIDDETHHSMKKSSVHHNDILITKTGRINTENSSLGRAALYKGADDSANINGHVYLVRLKDDVIPEYVVDILASEAYRKYIRRVCVGGIDKRQINLDHVEAFPIIVPSMQEQVNYLNLRNKVEEAKKPIQESLNRLQTLKASLMQEYFS